MAYGNIYSSTWWGNGVPNSIGWGSVYSDLASSFNRYAVRFDGLTPGESITVATDNGYEITESEGITIMAWARLDSDLDNGTYNQKCIVDYSRNPYNTANGEGYSLFVRKTATLFTMNWFYKRVGLSMSECRVTIDLNLLSLDKPMLILATLYPDGSGNTIQNMRIWQEGAGVGVDYIDATQKTTSIKGTIFPTLTQNVCFGNTNATGTVTSEFIGEIDEVVIYSGDLSTNVIQMSDEYFSGRDDEYYLDLRNLAYYNDIVGWYRFGDPEIIEAVGGGLFFDNQSDGVGSAAFGDSSLDRSDIVNQIIY